MSDTCENCGAPLSIGAGSAESEIDSLKEQRDEARNVARHYAKMIWGDDLSKLPRENLDTCPWLEE